MLVHILVGLKYEDVKNLKLEYIKILGFKEEGQKYLNKLKKDIKIPLRVQKDSFTYQMELRCAALYDLFSHDDNLKYEKTTKPLKF